VRRPDAVSGNGPVTLPRRRLAGQLAEASGGASRGSLGAEQAERAGRGELDAEHGPAAGA
jgi:hypothetical protein